MKLNRFCSDTVKAIKAAYELLEDAGIKTFPVDLLLIFKQLETNVRLKTYSDFCNNEGKNLEDKNILFSQDAFTIYNATRGLYIVYYNENKPKTRIRFSIAHELGHICLDHFSECEDTSLISKELLSADVYKILETEANTFALNLLAPANAAEALLNYHGIINKGWKDGHYNWEQTDFSQPFNIANYSINNYMKNAFIISNKASEVRRDKLQRDVNYIKCYGINFDYILNINHTMNWFCDKCHTTRHRGAKYCATCGNNQFSFGQITNSYKIVKRKGNKVGMCPICGNTEFSEDANFCKICGAPLANYCTNPTEQHANHPQSLYCTECGYITENYRNDRSKTIWENIKDSWSLKKFKHEVFNISPITKRLTECPRCKARILDEANLFCPKCELTLQNLCTNNIFGNPINSSDCYKSNPPDARYCEACGAETSYFKEYKILKPYNEEA